MSEHEGEVESSAPEAVAPGRPLVRLEVFEGPLDLLLHLIKKNEVEIVDIPIAKITEQYLSYLDLLHELNLDIAGEFLVMAATLTLIKSRMLLPEEPADPEEEEGDPRADLVRQLLEYQRYREAAAGLGERPQLNQEVFAREASWDTDEARDAEPAPIKVSMWELIEAFRKVLERSKPVSVHQVVLEQVSLRDRIRFVLARLGAARRLDFEALFSEDATRLQIIVTFLAILELAKVHAIEALQEEPFGPITVALVVDDPSQVSVDLFDEYEAAPAPSTAASAAAEPEPAIDPATEPEVE